MKRSIFWAEEFSPKDDFFTHLACVVQRIFYVFTVPPTKEENRDKDFTPLKACISFLIPDHLCLKDPQRLSNL